MMHVALGIDTGGTYTDAVLLDHERGTVLVSAKVLTTYHDLSLGIGQAIARVLEAAPNACAGLSPADIVLVGLSTTLATNAIVEGRGGRVCLILIGYDPDWVRRQSDGGLDRITRDVVFIQGGHDCDGNERAPLDEATVREAVAARLGRVDAFAVSGYFGVRNPEHELRVRALIQDVYLSCNQDGQPDFPITCGHELTTRLDALRRAATAALNARLIPLLRELIASVCRAMEGAGIRAPLMVVRGDGSLARAAWAMERPIETILSGPAASVIGAWHLAGRRDAWVVDVGGTTTDIALLRDGHPRLNPEGAQVGPWQTMVEAIDAFTVGLGGDSWVRLDGNVFPASGGLSIGPQRAVPLSLLAAGHPPVLDDLRRQRDAQVGKRLSPAWGGRFILLQRFDESEMSSFAGELVRQLANGPRSLDALVHELGRGPLLSRLADELVARQQAVWSAWTPTDALHVLERFSEWNVEAAQLGAELLAARMGMPVAEFCERVVALVSDRIAAALIEKVLSDEEGHLDWQGQPALMALIGRALGRVDGSMLGCRLDLKLPIVAVGAPVSAFLPRVAGQLGCELIIPDHFEVANAVGAVVGSVVQRRRVLVQAVDSFYRLYLPDGVRDFGDWQDAVGYAMQVMPGWMEQWAHKAGAQQVEVRSERRDIVLTVEEGAGQEVFVGCEILFTAAGRPVDVEMAIERGGGKSK